MCMSTQVNQILISTNMIGVCEGLLYAQKAGLDLDEVIAAVGAGAAGSFSINTLGPRIAKRNFVSPKHFISIIKVMMMMIFLLVVVCRPFSFVFLLIDSFPSLSPIPFPLYDLQSSSSGPRFLR